MRHAWHPAALAEREPALLLHALVAFTIEFDNDRLDPRGGRPSGPGTGPRWQDRVGAIPR
jgi:hypothetical protein